MYRYFLKVTIMNRRPVIFSAALVCAISCGTGAALAQGHGGHTMMTPGDLKWGDVASLPKGAQIAVLEGPLNEAKPFTFRLKFPANYQIPPHSHTAVERVTVLSGTFNMGTGDKFERSQTTALSAGGLAVMQPGTTHYAWTDQETVVQLNGVGPWTITYVNPADDPRTKQ
jgi:quercetin dioxygenase-like cupin family protein